MEVEQEYVSTLDIPTEEARLGVNYANRSLVPHHHMVTTTETYILLYTENLNRHTHLSYTENTDLMVNLNRHTSSIHVYWKQMHYNMCGEYVSVYNMVLILGWVNPFIEINQISQT